MKTNLLFALSLLFTSSVLSARDFSDNIPEGSVLFLEVPDINRQRANAEFSPLAQAMKKFDWQKSLVAIVEEAWENGEIDEDEAFPANPEEFKAGLKTFTERSDEVAKHLNGSIAFALGDLTTAVRAFLESEKKRDALYENINWDAEDESDEDNLQMQKLMEAEEVLEAAEMRAVFSEFYFFAEVNDGAALLTKIEGWLEELFQEQSDEELVVALKKMDWDGTPVYTVIEEVQEEDKDAPKLEYPSLWWTVHDGVWVIAATETRLRESLDSLKNPQGTPLSATRSYQESMQYLGEQDLFLLMDFSRIDPLIRLALGDALQEMAPNGKTMGEMMDWMGLDALLPYAIGIREDREGMHGKGLFGFSRPTPLSRILIDPSDDPAPTPPFMHKDFPQITSMHWGIGRFVRQLEKEIGTFEPNAAAQMAMGKGMLMGMLGLDIQTQFLDHIGSGLVLAQEMDPSVSQKLLELTEKGTPAEVMQFQMANPTNGQNVLFGIELKDTQGFTSGLNTLMSKMHPAGLPEPKMFDGHPIHYPMPVMPGQEDMNSLVTYTILDDYLLVSIGSPSLLHKAIKASNEPAVRIWNTEGYQNLRDRFPMANIMEYTQGKLQKASFQTIQQSMNMMFENPANAPDLTVFGDIIGNSIGTSKRNGTRFEFESLMTFNTPE